MSRRRKVGWGKTARSEAAAAVQERIEAHDRLVLPAIREYRADGLGYGRIAALLDLAFDPPGRSGAAMSPMLYSAGGWTKAAVRRICERHGLARTIEGVSDLNPGMTDKPVTVGDTPPKRPRKRPRTAQEAPEAPAEAPRTSKGPQRRYTPPGGEKPRPRPRR